MHAKKANGSWHNEKAETCDVNDEKYDNYFIVLLLFALERLLELFSRDLILRVDTIVHLNKLVFHKVDVCIGFHQSFSEKKQVEK